MLVCRAGPPPARLHDLKSFACGQQLQGLPLENVPDPEDVRVPSLEQAIEVCMGLLQSTENL